MYKFKDFSHLTKEERLKRLASYWSIFINSDTIDEDAFACVYQLSIDDLYAYACSFGIDEATCEDVIHEMFCNLYSKYKQLSHVENILSYMIAAIRNRLVNVHKKRTRSSDEYSYDLPFTTEVTVMDSMIREEERDSIKQTVERMLQQLTPRQREAIYLHYMENMEYTEIANLMNMNVDSVRKLVYRAFIALRQQNTQHIPFIIILMLMGH